MKKYIPKEHGVWLLLLLPAVSSLFISLTGEHIQDTLLATGKGAFFLFLISSFFLTVPAHLLRKGKEDIRGYLPGMVLIGSVWLLALCILAQEGKTFVLFASLSPLILFFIASSFIDIVRHPMLKLCMPVALPFSAVAGVLLRNDAAFFDAVSLYVLFLFFFFPRHTYTVEHFIQRGGKEGAHRKSLLYSLFCFVGSLLFLVVGIKNSALLCTLPFFFLLPLYIILKKVQWKSIRQYGRREMYISILFTLCIIFLY